ncbi:MAG TPA: fibronectin type III domain-containing protein [Candidatus Paceibacterota bacterium]
MNKLRIGFLSGGAFLAVLFVASAALPLAHAQITAGELSVGSSGSQVTQLQQFLATNSKIYPSGDVTGYFGPLTQAAVTQFQVAYGISQVGQVGPITSAKINDIMASGFGLDTTVPVMNNLGVSQINPTTAVVDWNTYTLTLGQVFFSTSPIQTNEATGVYQIPYIGGNGANTNNDASVGTNHSVQLTGLQPNTLYYYIARSIDQSGNVTMSEPMSFQTN